MTERKNMHRVDEALAAANSAPEVEFQPGELPAGLSRETFDEAVSLVENPPPASTQDTSARAAEDGRPVEPEPRTLPHYHYPIPRAHTGKLQFRTDRAGSVSIDLIGDVHRGGVIAVKNKKFARGLIDGGSFANAPADAPLGQPPSMTLRTSLRGRRDLDPAIEKRVAELVAEVEVLERTSGTDAAEQRAAKVSEAVLLLEGPAPKSPAK